jgi:hypothetical protein
MRMARIDQVTMDLIGADHRALAQATIRHSLELIAPEDTAERILRIAEDEQPSIRERIASKPFQSMQ